VSGDGRARRGRAWRRVWGRVEPAALPVAGTVSGIGLWWGVTAAFRIRPLFLPAPDDLVDAFRREPGYLLAAGWATLWMTLAGFALAAVLGFLTGAALTASPVVERATMPLLVALNSVPKVALAPLLVVWLGFGVQPEILMVALIAFFPVIVSTTAGLSSTPADLRELARSMSAPGWRIYLSVRLPWALPQIFTGLKVAVALALIGAVVAEIANPDRGFGAVVVFSSTSLDTPLAFAAIGLLAVTSIALFYAVVAAERLLVPWARTV